MISQFRFRTRTYLVAVAFLAPLLFGVIEVGRHGGWRRFRAYHALRARDYGRAAGITRRGVEMYSKHLAHRVPCPTCPSVWPLRKVVDNDRSELRDLEWRAWWHGLLSLFWEPMIMGGAET